MIHEAVKGLLAKLARENKEEKLTPQTTSDKSVSATVCEKEEKTFTKTA